MGKKKSSYQSASKPFHLSVQFVAWRARSAVDADPFRAGVDLQPDHEAFAGLQEKEGGGLPLLIYGLDGDNGVLIRVVRCAQQ